MRYELLMHVRLRLLSHLVVFLLMLWRIKAIELLMLLRKHWHLLLYVLLMMLLILCLPLSQVFFSHMMQI